MYKIKGKVAFITGGTGGIGFAICKALLNDDAAGVTLFDINASEDLVKSVSHQFPDRVLLASGNVTNIDEVEQSFQRTISKFGRLDIIVNNAGILHDDTFKMLSVNTGAPINITQLAIEKYLNEGVIINMASIAAFIPIEECIYAATKSALVAFGRSMSRIVEMEERQIRVITICPGATLTNMYREIQKVMDEELLKRFPIQEPSVVGKAVAKLAQDGANGSIWVIDDCKMFELEYQRFSEMKKTLVCNW